MEFLGRSEDAELAARAQPHVDVIREIVRSYTRGVGFDIGGHRDVIADDLAAVIVTAAVRLMDNPALVDRFQMGGFSMAGGGFHGFTLPELAVLHNYRRRSA